MDRRISLAGALVAGCAMLAGCSDPGNTMAHAEQLATGYYQALQNKDFEKAAGFFFDQADAPRQQWLDQIREYNSKLGDLQSYKLMNETVNTVYSGTRYILRYRTQYSKSPAMETLVLFDRVSDLGGNRPMGLGIENLLIKSKGL
jgi:hypothetical protein